MIDGLRQIFNKKSSFVILFFGVLIAVLPIFTQDRFFITIGIYCLLFASFAVAWNIIGGYGAQVSWCHATFAACGAYTGYLFYHFLGISPLLTMPIGMLIAYVLATVIGRGTFKLRGVFFALSTIALAEIFRILLLYFRDFTGGSAGRFITYRGNHFYRLSFSNDIPFYYISLVLLIIVMVVTALFQKTKAGHFLGAIKGDEDAATTLGIETFKMKLLAFQLSAVLTSVIGMVFGFYMTYIDPYSIASLDLSVQIGMGAIVGGLGTLWGPVLGAFLLQSLTQFTNAMFAHVSGASMMMYALVLILVVRFRPQGLITLFTKNEDNIPEMMKRANRFITRKK